MRVLITGAGGYLGTQLVRALLDEEAQGPRYHLHLLDRFDHGVQPLVSAVGPHGDQVTVFAGDVCDPRMLVPALQGCDAVVHLAGIVGYPACDADPAEADRTNVMGTATVCAHLETRPLLFASTGSTYGKVSGVATEETPISPLTRYGRNKADAERLVQEVGGVSFRLATLFGMSDRMRWDLLPHTFAKEAVERGQIHLYEGEARRVFLHVADAAAAFRAALECLPPSWGGEGGEVYNVGGAGSNVTKRDVAAVVHALTGCSVVKADGHDPDQRDYAVDFGKIAADLPEWAERRRTRLADGLADVLRWARVWR